MHKGHNIGRGLGLVRSWVDGCFEDDAFGDAMGAPMDELGPMINRGRAKELRRLKRRIKGVTGLKWRAFVLEVERRTSARWVHFCSAIGCAEQYNGIRRQSW